MKRRTFLAFWVLTVFVLLLTFESVQVPEVHQLANTYLERFNQDTNALNAVTAIYLDYRLFDTLFETLTLLVSVIGIIYFSRHEGGY